MQRLYGDPVPAPLPQGLPRQVDADETGVSHLQTEPAAHQPFYEL